MDDPMYTADELAGKGLTPYQTGTAVDAVVIQAMHETTARITGAPFRGCRAVVDGRNLLDPGTLPEDVAYIGVGRGNPHFRRTGWRVISDLWKEAGRA